MLINVVNVYCVWKQLNISKTIKNKCRNSGDLNESPDIDFSGFNWVFDPLVLNMDNLLCFCIMECMSHLIQAVIMGK